jgi:hypothetical protein
MDDLCLSLRVFRQLNSESQSDVAEWIENLPDFLETAEEAVINQLCDILLEELDKGINTDRIGAIVRTSGDAIGSAPLARKHHFIYGILDLIQQHIQPIDSGKINYKVMEFSLQVIKKSPYSYLRCKAFEVLAAMSSKPGIGQAPVQRVNELLGSDIWPESAREKAFNQWRIMRKRALDDDYYLIELRSKSPNIEPINPTAAQVQKCPLKCNSNCR